MKKLLSTILTVVMCLLLAAPTWAANTSSSKCGTNLTWALDDKGTLTVSGTGAMDDYDMYSILPPWDGLKDKIKEVVIGNGVTTIGLSAFPGCSNLSSIKIGEGLKTIKWGAFYYCDSLSSVTFPKSVTEIAELAFGDCRSITDVYYGGSEAEWKAISIDNSNDRLLSSKVAIHYNSGVPAENSGFKWSLDNGTLTISGTGEIPDYEREGQAPWAPRNSVKKIVIEKGITRIGKRAFAGCENLTSVSIADSVKSIGSEAFRDCKNLTSATIPSNVTFIGEGAFSGCIKLNNIDIQNGVKKIDAFAFSGCRSLKNVNIPSSISSIGAYAFMNCSSLESIEIPNGVVAISGECFSQCSSLKSVTIPKSVNVVIRRAFEGCSNLMDVYYGGSEVEWRSIDIDDYMNLNDSLRNAKIHYNSTARNSVSVTVNGSAIKWTDATPFINSDGRTMVPLRAVGDALGLTVSWDGSAREAVFTDGRKTIYFPINKSTARTSGGGTVKMDTAAIVIDGRTYAPVRYLAEYFGHIVDWDGTSRTVIIK